MAIGHIWGGDRDMKKFEIWFVSEDFFGYEREVIKLPIEADSVETAQVLGDALQHLMYEKKSTMFDPRVEEVNP
jgi:hypothetical protein